MSLIACTDPCIYQKEGYCSLSRAVSLGTPGRGGCVHFVPVRAERPSQQGGQGLPDIGHAD